MGLNGSLLYAAVTTRTLEFRMILEKLVQGITGTPEFQRFQYKDYNPLAGTTKYRMIGAPNEPMRVVHARLIENLRRLPIDHRYSVGARVGWNPMKNVALHRFVDRSGPYLRYTSHRYFYLVDLTDAYGHIDAQSLAEILRQYDEWSDHSVDAIRDFLNTYCFAPATTEQVQEARQLELWPIKRGRIGLVQGGPASPDLFNTFAAVRLDAALALLCEKYRLTYSRYLDDLTFSSRDEVIGTRKRVALLNVIRGVGFHINHRKSQVLDTHVGPVTINGVAMDRTGRLYLPRWYVRYLRGLLHQALTTGKPEPAIMHGKMGVFLGTLPRSRRLGYLPRNQVERGLLERYRFYKKQHRRPRITKTVARLPKLPKRPRLVDLDDWF